MGLRELRRDILALMVDCGAPNNLFISYRIWTLILVALFEQLTECPITFPDKPTASVQKYIDRMKPISIGLNFVPHTLYITDRSQMPSEPGRPAGFYWNIRLTPLSAQHFAELNGPLQTTETMLDFLQP